MRNGGNGSMVKASESPMRIDCVTTSPSSGSDVAMLLGVVDVPAGAFSRMRKLAVAESVKNVGGSLTFRMWRITFTVSFNASDEFPLPSSVTRTVKFSRLKLLVYRSKHGSLKSRI